MSLRGGPSVLLGDDRAVLERAGSCQAADGGRVDVVGPSDDISGGRCALDAPWQP